MKELNNDTKLTIQKVRRIIQNRESYKCTGLVKIAGFVNREIWAYKFDNFVIITLEKTNGSLCDFHKLSTAQYQELIEKYDSDVELYDACYSIIDGSQFEINAREKEVLMYGGTVIKKAIV